MRVTIWDMDYYYAAEKRDMFNPDVMKLSSYHKQKGDYVNFVRISDDIYRPYDIYYIIREDPKTPQPPKEFFLNGKVKWFGQANKARRNFRLNNVMLSCRPDYLLYPEKDTMNERSDQLRLLGHDGKILQLTQDYVNTFKRKRTLVIDDNLWTTDAENCISALKKLVEIKNVSFYEPIWLPKLLDNKDIREAFFELNLTIGANLRWLPIQKKHFDAAMKFVQEVKEKWPNTAVGPLVVKMNFEEHWEKNYVALADWQWLQQAVVEGKKKGIVVQLDYKGRLSTPYFMPFEAVTRWMIKRPRLSWIEFIQREYGRSGENVFNKPGTWTPVFRDLLRQTYKDREFLTLKWENSVMSVNEVPWNLFEKEFQIGL